MAWPLLSWRCSRGVGAPLALKVVEEWQYKVARLLIKIREGCANIAGFAGAPEGGPASRHCHRVLRRGTAANNFEPSSTIFDCNEVLKLGRCSDGSSLPANFTLALKLCWLGLLTRRDGVPAASRQ